MNRSWIAAIGITVVLIVWMLSGLGNAPVEAEQTAPATAKRLNKVQVMPSQARMVQRLVRVQGQVEAKRVISLKAEVEGKVVALPVSEGENAQRGQLLVQLAADARPAQVAEMKARVAQRDSELKAAEKLMKRGLGSENDVIRQRAEFMSAEAALDQAELQLKNTHIYAPFDAVTNRLEVELGDYVDKGEVVAQLVDDAKLVVAGQVPQHSVGSLELGQPVLVEIQTSRTAAVEQLVGQLEYVSATADTQTRSYTAEVHIDNAQKRRLIGLSATLLMPLETLAGHWVPSSALGLASDGGLQVKVVDADQRVNALAVDLIRTGQDGFWLAGLPDNANIITLGQDFVSSGEQVEVDIQTMEAPAVGVLAAVAASHHADSGAEASQLPAEQDSASDKLSDEDLPEEAAETNAEEAA
ncbi:MAG: efflux RND transporter periplasmic adaptor subunit [Xanthomonadales bacterium]|nr:efflux RND transporter periplasmic adaptor subunit [Xanthomonadales bacterium]